MLSINNMATLFVFMFAAPIGIMGLAMINKLYPIWRLLPTKFEVRVQNYVDQTIRGAFWNSTISFFNENYLVLSVCFFIQVQSLQIDPKVYYWSAILCSCIGIVGAAFSLTFPLLILVVYSRKLKSSTVTLDISNVMVEDKHSKLQDMKGQDVTQTNSMQEFTE